MSVKKKKFEWGYLLLIPGIGFILYFLGTAIVMMLMQSVGFYNYTGESKFSLDFWKNIFSQNLLDNTLFSLKIAIFTATIALVVVYPLAIITKNLRNHKVWLSLLKIPMYIPAQVACLLILNVIGYNGVLNHFLQWLGVISEPLRLKNDPWGVTTLLTQLWKNIPFMLVTIFPAVEGVRKDVLDSALDLGASRIQQFFEVTLPLTMPTALVTFLMVFIRVFNDYIIANLTGPLYPSSVSNLMYQRAYLFNDWHSAACIGVLMICSSLLIVTLYTKLGDYYQKIS